MIRIIWPGALPGDRFQRFFHPSIDRLLSIIEGKKYLGDSLEKLSNEFSAILRHIRIGNVWKRTRQNRIKVADRALFENLENKNFRTLRFLDVGGSDGTTTLDTVNYLGSRLGVKVEAYLADKYLFLLRRRKGYIYEYIATDGQPVLVRCGPLALLLGPTEKFNGFLYKQELWLTKWIASSYLRLNKFRSLMQMNERIILVNPKVLLSNRLRLIEMDMFQIIPDLIGSMDVVRVSNVLISEYFSKNQIRNAINNIKRYLKQDGLLLLSRNHDEVNGEVERGSIWQKVEGDLVHLMDFGGGSELFKVVKDNFN